MKPLAKESVLVFMIAMLAFVSCKKDDDCETCNEENKWPVANAGKDTIIVLPTDKIRLDGGASKDTDGNIAHYNWSPIYNFYFGAVSSIQDPNAKQTEVTNLRMGMFRFELKVTDNKGAYALDTVIVQVEDKIYPPHPVGFYPVFDSGFSWNTTAAGLKVIGPVSAWQFSDASSSNDGSKWKVQLVQSATNTTIFLPYVKYDGIATTNHPVFYSIWDLVVFAPGENPLGSIYVFANPTQTSGIDLTKPVAAIVYVKF